MTKLLAGVLCINLAVVQPPNTPLQKRTVPQLEAGQLAPVLRATKWPQGEPVVSFERGRIYVIVFWASWCEPCVMMMPCLAELQAKYRDKGVTVIGYSARDEKNTDQDVAAFVQKRGPKLPFTFAYADDRRTYGAWMTAADQRGVPGAFVVDKAGRIAYIGHPFFLGLVIPRVVGGEAPQALRDEVNKVAEESAAVGKALTGPDANAGLKALREFETKYPSLAHDCSWLFPRLRALVKAGQVREAKTLAESTLARATGREDSETLFFLSVHLRDKENGGALLGPAVRAAEVMVRVAGDKDARALINLARTYSEAGNDVKARDYARRAAASAARESAAVRQRIEKEARELEHTLRLREAIPKTK
jgi:thiol-disulfide isomerase/thioredoxin